MKEPSASCFNTQLLYACLKPRTEPIVPAESVPVGAVALAHQPARQAERRATLGMPDKRAKGRVKGGG
jgi:hypothetical protein